MNAAAETKDISMLEAWQRHVLDCEHCSQARTGDKLCQMGMNFWRIPGSATMPIVQEVHPIVPMVSAPVPPSQQVAMTVNVVPSAVPMSPAPAMAAAFDIGALAARVTERVVARSTSGAAIAVPMEKTSTSVEIRTSRDVVLRMPERDIEVYSAMRGAIPRFLRLAEMMGTFYLAEKEARQMARSAGVMLDDQQTAMVVRQVSHARGMGDLSAEQLYAEFEDVKMLVIRLGDYIGRFMAVDTETRAVMRDVRTLGMEMQGELERSPGGRLVVDDSSPQVTRGLRMLAVALQGEMERRLGT